MAGFFKAKNKLMTGYQYRQSLEERKPINVYLNGEKIGEHVASLIPDRANLQLGIGSMPDTVLKFLKGKKDLGIHSEMFSDGVVDLFNAGVITNKYNNLNPGKFTACFLMGTQHLYDFVDNNSNVLMKPVYYTNNIMIAGRKIDKV